MKSFKKFMLKVFVYDWQIKYPIIISLVSAAFTGVSLYSQIKSADHYERNTQQVIINSTELADYQLDLLIGKVGNAPRVPITPNNMEFQINSLQQNLSVIRDVQITNLPKNESMNYQTYRQDLSDMVFKLNGDVKGLKQKYNVKDSEAIPLDDKDKSNLLHSLVQLKYAVDQDSKLIKENKNLYDNKYRVFVQKFNSKNRDFMNGLLDDEKNLDLNNGYNY